LTVSSSINARGDVTGYFSAGGSMHGFVRDTNGKITVFDAPGAVLTVSSSINQRGDVTGYFQDAIGTNRGFVRDANGNFAVFEAPKAVLTVSSSINARADVTGYFNDVVFLRERGFVRDANGNYTVFDAPSATRTESTDINARGDVTGTFFEGSRGHGLCGKQMEISPFSIPPNSIAIFNSSSIHDGGEVTGSFVPMSNPFRASGFVRDAAGNFSRFDAPNAAEPIQLGTNSLSINAQGYVTGYFNDMSQFFRRRSFVRDSSG